MSCTICAALACYEARTKWKQWLGLQYGDRPNEALSEVEHRYTEHAATLKHVIAALMCSCDDDAVA